MRGFYFRPLTHTDWQKQQPLVHPVLDYNKRFAGPGLLGGEFTIDANVTSLSRELGRDVTTTDVLPLVERHLRTYLAWHAYVPTPDYDARPEPGRTPRIEVLSPGR